MLETELYEPVKRFLEAQGYAVKAEVRGCDVVAVRGDEAPVVVELKTRFSLPLLIQGVDRQAVTDAVYVATALPDGISAHKWLRQRRGAINLCKRLGLGILTVKMDGGERQAVKVHLDPAPYRPRLNTRRRTMLLKEFESRAGDPNNGGSTRRPIVTAYRQDALRCVKFLVANQTAKLADIRTQTGVERAGGILQRDHYGWFQRVDRGIYGLSAKGTGAVAEFAEALKVL
jgi:hypothetical protein